MFSEEFTVQRVESAGKAEGQPQECIEDNGTERPIEVDAPAGTNCNGEEKLKPDVRVPKVLRQGIAFRLIVSF